MGYFIDENSQYYAGDKRHHSHIVVTKRPGVEYSWDGQSWVLDPAKSKDKSQAAIRNQITAETPYFAMLFIHLIQKLIQKGVVSASDFSAADQALYNKIKTWVDNYLNL